MDENLRITRERVDIALGELMEYNSQDIGDLITDLFAERKYLIETLEFMVRLEERLDLPEPHKIHEMGRKSRAVLAKIGVKQE